MKKAAAILISIILIYTALFNLYVSAEDTGFNDCKMYYAKDDSETAHELTRSTTINGVSYPEGIYVLDGCAGDVFTLVFGTESDVQGNLSGGLFCRTAPLHDDNVIIADNFTLRFSDEWVGSMKTSKMTANVGNSTGINMVVAGRNYRSACGFRIQLNAIGKNDLIAVYQLMVKAADWAETKTFTLGIINRAIVSEDSGYIIDDTGNLQESDPGLTYSELAIINHTDQNSNISINGDAVPWNVKITVQKVEATETGYQSIKNRTCGTILACYDIHLYDMLSEMNFELSGGKTATVTIPINNNDDSVIQVYRRDDNGTLELIDSQMIINAEAQKTYVSFRAGVFSEFAVVSVPFSENEIENLYSISPTPNAAGWNHTDVTITPASGYTISTSLSGLYTTALAISASVTGYEFYIGTAEGKTIGAITLNEIKIDKTQPTVLITGDTEHYKQSDIVTIVPTAGASGIAKIEVQKDGGDSTDITSSYSSGYTVSDNGTYTFIVTNGAGSTGTASITYDKIGANTYMVSLISSLINLFKNLLIQLLNYIQ